jgi:pSer/pThr/pTyr-binding forkhead associated (FHA) protein
LLGVAIGRESLERFRDRPSPSAITRLLHSQAPLAIMPPSKPPREISVTTATTHPPIEALALGRRKREAVLAFRDDSGPCEVTLTESTTLGTAPHVPVCIVDRTVSRLHVEIEPTEDGVWIEDLGSRNGTYFQGARVARICLPDNSRIRIGNTDIHIRHTLAHDETPLFALPTFGKLLGRSPVMREIFERIRQIAPTDETVLIRGETGTGKELVAESIHENSPRSGGPFVVVDCGSLPEHLLDSELFGHVRGAFTGAESDRRGAVQEADGGTLFLDEIGELPMSVQPRLLRALESRSVRRVGESTYRKVNVRFVAATHRDLRAMVNAKTFREDLYFRLSVLRVEVPPLRSRVEDVPLSVRHNGEPTDRTASPPRRPPRRITAPKTADACPMRCASRGSETP